MKYNYKHRWLKERKLKGLPANLRRLLIDNSSLTKRIILDKNDHIKFISSQINLTRQFGKSSRKFSLVRKVELSGVLEKPISATSYTLVSNIKGRMCCIKRLGEKSLATLLFKKPKFIKETVNYIVKSDYVLRTTLFKKRKLYIKVEETFPKCNNYFDLRLIECRKNLIN